MSMFQTLIALLVLAGCVALWRFIRRRFGRFQALVILKNTPKPTRTRGEIDRELWDQKGALDRAIEATAAATVAQHQAATAAHTARDLPDPPCEVEPPAAYTKGPSPSMVAATRAATGPVKALAVLILLGLSSLACARPAPVPWHHHCRACGKSLDVGKPKDPSYRPICVTCYCEGK